MQKAPNLGLCGVDFSTKRPKVFWLPNEGRKSETGGFLGLGLGPKGRDLGLCAQQNQGGFYGIEDKKGEVWGFVIGSGSEKAELGSWFWFWA